MHAIIVILFFYGQLYIVSTLTPQELYMRQMTDRLQMASSMSQNSDILASTPELTSITGLDNEGYFVLSSGNSLQLKTYCSNLLSQPYKTLYFSSVWIFPKVSESENITADVLDVEFAASVSSPIADVNIKKVLHTWDKNSSCMFVDIRRVLKKYNVKGIDTQNHHCTITITVTDITSGIRSVESGDGMQMCKVFNDRDSITPFVFLSYFNGEQDYTERDHSPSKRFSRNDTHNSCQFNDFYVNLTEIIGSILYPSKLLNIGMCQGSCDTQTTPSFRQQVFDLVSNDTVNSTIASSYSSRCCTPKYFKPYTILIQTDNRQVIEFVDDVVVESCMCTI